MKTEKIETEKVETEKVERSEGGEREGELVRKEKVITYKKEEEENEI